MKPYQLIPNWRAVLARAWSVRWIVVAGLLSGAEVLLTAFPDVLGLPRGVLAGATGIVTVLAFNLLGDGLRDALDPKLRR